VSNRIVRNSERVINVTTGIPTVCVVPTINMASDQVEVPTAHVTMLILNDNATMIIHGSMDSDPVEALDVITVLHLVRLLFLDLTTLTRTHEVHRRKPTLPRPLERNPRSSRVRSRSTWTSMGRALTGTGMAKKS
jgi:hypothetical protein|tara:strand:+ start:815 stop:1219 length:405 start_codon:yes stop_codon:yes gene_type:complete